MIETLTFLFRSDSLPLVFSVLNNQEKFQCTEYHVFSSRDILGKNGSGGGSLNDTVHSFRNEKSGAATAFRRIHSYYVTV